MPLRKPRDAERFRNAYLGTLSLQQEVDLKNYNANALYKRTGVVPSQILDYRSPQEIMADIERLRILVRSELKEIADDKNAEDIAMELTADQLQFVAQNMPILIRIIKPRYRFGIPKDIFIPYLVKYMNDEMQNRIIQAGLSIVDAPVDVDSNPFDDIDVDKDKLFMETIQDLLDFVDKITTSGGPQRQVVDEIKNQLQLNRSLYPSERLLQRIEDVDNEDDKEKLFVLQSELKDSLISTEQLKSLLDKFNETMNNEKALFDNLRSSLGELTPLTGLIESKQEIEDLLSPIATAEVISSSRSRKSGTDQTVGVILSKLPDKDSLLQHRDLKGMGRNKMGVISKEEMKDLLKPYYDAKVISYSKGKNNSSVSLEEMYQTIDDNYDKMEEAYIKQSGRTLTSRPFVSGPTFETLFASPSQKGPSPSGKYSPSQFPIDYTSGFGIKGKGIGVEDKYALLGKFNIHLHKLRDDVLALHSLEGKSSYRFKPRKVSVNVGNVVRKIVNRVSPSFEDLSKLTEEDKQILNELIKLTKINVDIPLPTEDKEDLNQFEIMKGQLLAGNDSKDMVKKFKLLIMKLSHSGRLPKSQAKDLIMDLVQLGY